MKKWYEELFDDYGAGYDRELFTQGTIQEVNFIERELGYDKSLEILDIGCGTGRHSIELASRGYKVTGVDLSESLLNRARWKASERGLAIPFVRHDARNLPCAGEFDTALLICEAAFPLMETDEMNFEILKSARKALRSPGKLILTTLNALYPLSQTGASSDRFDLDTFRMSSEIEVRDDHGRKKTLQCNERYYAPSEIRWLLSSLGFSEINIYGCAPGEFNNDRMLTKDDYEMLVVAGC